MPRRLILAPATLAIVALVAACGGPASAPALSDPKDIIAQSLDAVKGAQSVHLDATVDGTVNVDLTGTGAGSDFPLTGTTASADIDMAGSKARATFSIPAIMGLSGELIQIGDTSYVKTSLTGPKYQQQQATDALPVEPDPSASIDPAAMLDQLDEFLSRPEIAPTKGDDIACGQKQCYQVLVELTPEEIAAIQAETGAGPIPSELPVDIGSTTLGMTLRVEKDTLRPAGIALTADMGAQGSITLDLTASKWDEAVDITAPPADQIQGAS